MDLESDHVSFQIDENSDDASSQRFLNSLGFGSAFPASLEGEAPAPSTSFSPQADSFEEEVVLSSQTEEWQLPGERKDPPKKKRVGLAELSNRRQSSSSPESDPDPVISAEADIAGEPLTLDAPSSCSSSFSDEATPPAAGFPLEAEAVEFADEPSIPTRSSASPLLDSLVAPQPVVEACESVIEENSSTDVTTAESEKKIDPASPSLIEGEELEPSSTFIDPVEEVPHENGSVSVNCPSCSEELILQREHLGVEGACVHCEAALVAAQSGADGKVSAFLISVPAAPAKKSEEAAAVVEESEPETGAASPSILDAEMVQPVLKADEAPSAVATTEVPLFDELSNMSLESLETLTIQDFDEPPTVEAPVEMEVPSRNRGKSAAAAQFSQEVEFEAESEVLEENKIQPLNSSFSGGESSGSSFSSIPFSQDLDDFNPIIQDSPPPVAVQSVDAESPMTEPLSSSEAASGTVQSPFEVENVETATAPDPEPEPKERSISPEWSIPLPAKPETPVSAPALPIVTEEPLHVTEEAASPEKKEENVIQLGPPTAAPAEPQPAPEGEAAFAELQAEEGPPSFFTQVIANGITHPEPEAEQNAPTSEEAADVAESAPESQDLPPVETTEAEPLKMEQPQSSWGDGVRLEREEPVETEVHEELHRLLRQDEVIDEDSKEIAERATPFGSPTKSEPASASPDQSPSASSSMELPGKEGPLPKPAPAPPAQRSDDEVIKIPRKAKIALIAVLGLIAGVGVASFFLPVQDYVNHARDYMSAKFSKQIGLDPTWTKKTQNSQTVPNP